MRVLAASTLAAAVVATAVLLLGGSDYRLHLRFTDAGQLVEGGRVQIAGRKVGTIDAITLTNDGQADVEISISDGRYTPLHEGTRAAIRAVGQAGIANRYVDISPGSTSASPLASGARLTSVQTDGIVNLDALLDSFGPRQRRSLQAVIARSADIYAGAGATHTRSMLKQFPAALAEFRELYGSLADDRRSLATLTQSAAVATDAIASRRRDLVEAVANTAGVMTALSQERDTLTDSLERAPGVLRQAQGTMRGVDGALRALRPVLADVPPTAGPLDDLLRRLVRFLPRARSVTADLLPQLPDARRALTGLPPIERPTIQALRTTGGAMEAARHIFEGMRYYGSDFVLGALVSVSGLAAGPYDARGHYAKVNFVQNPQTVLSGKLANALTERPLLPGVLDGRTQLTRRCPGGDAPPAPDGSNPWELGPELCTPAHNMPASVNEP